MLKIYEVVIFTPPDLRSFCCNSMMCREITNAHSESTFFFNERIMLINKHFNANDDSHSQHMQINSIYVTAPSFGEFS